MKRAVVETGLQEADIRPAPLLSEFKRLSVIDASNYFMDPERLVEVDCPACGGRDTRDGFRLQEFLYNVCAGCGSWYVSPRPMKAALDEYYETSSASRFRVEHYCRDTAMARRRHLLRSNANWLGRMVDEIGNTTAKGYADYHTQLPVIFDEIRMLGLFDRLYSIDPLPALEQECRQLGVEVVKTPPKGLAAVTAFEKLENQYSPLDFLLSCAGALAEGGLLFFTTRTSSGFDLQVLRDKTPYIFVPEHLNLLSIEGLKTLVSRAGLALIELSTPGQLDLELTLHAAERDPSIELPPFVEYLLNHRHAEAHADFQAFLQKHRLSSHVRVAAAKGKATQ